jgi:Holliday junction resolvasome RuvABC endonuclease subunit
MATSNPIVLALYPNARGLGYACVELPQRLLDYGVVTVNPISNGKVLRRVEKFMDYLKPKIILIREGSSLTTFKAARIKKLIDAITTLAGEKNLTVHHYSRDQVKEVFEQFGATSKYQISQKIVSWFPTLKPFAPKVQKAWENEDYYMGIFDALSLIATHQFVTE